MHNKEKKLPIITRFQQYVNDIESDSKALLVVKFLMNERSYLAYFDKISGKYVIAADKH